MISPEYLTQQREMHARGDYGLFAHKWAGQVFELATANGCETILDYACGSGSLAKALGMPLREYDPAIEGKEADPKRSDLVVCLDALEHIEPEHLDAVLKHIHSKTRKLAFLVIATRPAKKFLPDGRNAHLIIETPDWWLNKLSEHFQVKNWQSGGKQLVVTACPIRQLGAIKVKGAVNDDLRFENVKRNVTVTAKRAEPAEPHDRVAVLCAYGPSLAQTWDAIAEERKHGDVISVSGAHDFLLQNGVVPDIHIECDPRAHKAKMVTPHKDVRYLLASCCDPDWVASLAAGGHDLTLWHLINGSVDQRLDELEPTAYQFGGGSSVGLRAIVLLSSLGYRRFIAHGLDCSYSEHGQHAGVHTGNPKTAMKVRCGDRWFDTHGGLVTYARQFIEDLVPRLPPETEFYLHGDGLLQAMCRIGEKNGSADQPGTE